MNRSIEAILAASEVRSEHVIATCNSVHDRLEHLDKCSRVICSRLEVLRALVGGDLVAE